MPAKPRTSCGSKQPRYVEIPPGEEDVRPQLEKHLSCDLSVEESFTTTDFPEDDVNKLMCGFPKKPVRERYPPFSSESWIDLINNEEATATLKKLGLQSNADPSSLEENQEAFEKLDFEYVIWKVGAVESEKSRSPTEHDDRDEPKSMEDGDVFEDNDDPSFLEENNSLTTTEGGKAALQSKDGELQSSDTEAVKYENVLKEKRKSMVKKKLSKSQSSAGNAVVKENMLQVKRESTAKKKESTSPFKRQSIGKKKRNKWIIICGEPLRPVRQKKPLVTKKACKAKKKHHSASQCKDSGVSSGSSYDSGSASGGDNGSEDCGRKNSGEGREGRGGGGGGFRRNGGMGGDGRDDDSDEKRPFSSGDTEMKDEEETDEDMKIRSKGSSAMDCEDDSLQQHSVEWQRLPFQTQHLQHSCYCSKEGNCDRPLCVEMKREIRHFKENFSQDCERCAKTMNLLKLHAATCHRPGCRVPNCLELRARKAPPPPQAVKDQPYNSQQSIPPHMPPSTDGQVLYCKSSQFGRFFQENINYYKGKLLGRGTNGDVFEIHFPPGSIQQKAMVVKETRYFCNKEEIDVYRSMGSHENIVEHCCATIKGHEYKMAVFMEKCDKSLKDICEERAMDTDEAMFYWTQVLVAVDHLHDNDIIHKDIKARNVMLCEVPGQGECCRAKLADFDSAKKLESEFTKSGLKAKGTRGFVAPEVLGEKPHGRPADIYSLGCFLLELHGITPKQNLLEQQIEQLCEKDPLQGKLVWHCVQQDYQNRPTAKEILNDSYIQEFLKVPDQR